MRVRALFTTFVAATIATGALGVPATEAAPPSVVGAQTSGDTLFPDQGNGGYDVSDYDLAIAWATGNTITATATIAAQTVDEPLSQFSLDLQGLTVSAVTVDGVTAAFSRITASPKFKLVVTPATPVDGDFTTVVTYSGTPVTHTDPDGSSEGWVATTDGAIALNEPVGAMTWFPNNNTPTDKATFTTKVTVPYNAVLSSGVTALSNGVLTSTVVNGSGTSATRTFTWTQDNQQATYLSLVGIGNYTTPNPAAGTPVALTVGSTPEWSYRDSLIADAAASFGTSRAKLSPILKNLESRYGTYPGASTGLVVDTVPSGVNYALETQDRPFFPTSIGQSTLIHELAHQWFGNAVSPTDWSDIWLNEGPATFLETQVANALYGGASTQDTYYSTWNSSTNSSAFWTTPGAGFTDASKLFASQVYTRGAIVLEALRSALGDAVFTQLMATWIETYGGGDASTDDFITLAEEISGYSLTAFFQDWLYDTDKPAAWPVAYELSLASSPATTSTVTPGSHVSYTLTAQNSGKVSTGASSVVTIDVADVIAGGGTLDALPARVTAVAGNKLEWSVPATAVGATATVTFGATLTSGPVTVLARGKTLGADCGVCRSTLNVVQGDIASATPTISGTPQVGATLTAVPGAWTSGASFTYQWLRGAAEIGGATASTYVPVAADVDQSVSVRVTGSKTGFNTVTRTSDPATVLAGVLAPTPTPTISGTPQVASTLTAVPGTWDAGATLGYQWLRNGVAIESATATTYTAVAADADQQLTVAVTGTRPGYNPATRTSDPVTVAPGTLSPTPTPSISGSPVPDQTLTAAPGTWDAGATLGYQWRLDSAPIAGATSATYVVLASQVGHQLSVAVTGTRPGYTSATRVSAPVTVDDGTVDPAPTPTVTGDPRVGATLTGVPGTWDNQSTLTYQWRVDGIAVTGAVALTFDPRPEDVGHDVTFEVIGTRGASTASRTSTPVTIVAGTLSPTPTPTISGSPTTGSTLTAVPGTWDGGAALTYQWSVGGSPVGGADAATFVVRPADVGQPITVAVTGTRTGYTSATRTSDPVTGAPGTITPAPTPTITGVVRVGQTITGVIGTWSDDASLTWQWLRNDVPIGPANALTYALTATDLGAVMTFEVTGTRPGYTTAVRSVDTAAVALGVQTKRPRPTVTGTFRVGKTLTAAAGAHDPGVTVTFRWFAGGKAIKGATSKKLKLTAAMRGKQVKVVTTATRPGYHPVVKSSRPKSVNP